MIEADVNVVCNRSVDKLKPPTSYIDKLKLQQLKDYAPVDQNPAHYQEDFLIPLELGGSPT